MVYSKHSNEELVAILQKGYKHDVFNILFWRFRPLFLNLRGIYPVPQFDKDDYYQEGRIIMLEAIDKYVPEHSTSFGAFFKVVYKNHLFNFMRTHYAKQRDSGREIGKNHPRRTLFRQRQGKFVDEFEDTEGLTPLEVMIIREQVSLYYADLSDYEKAILFYVLEGLTVEQISHLMEISEKSVKNAYYRCRTKLLEVLEEK